ncbi:MAG: glutathione S-transferase [Congregibacter sp.]|nr:glutathione S-transferase [Congregibacter sp.]
MDDDQALILHHFDASPFAEKIRLALGIKGLRWLSVDIPMVMPKPQLTALTGGYRKTPVLQIGADIYCDTQRIALELEQRFPLPSLFPDGRRAAALALTPWSDERFFRPGAALSMGTNPDLPEAVLADRRAFFSFLDFNTLDDRIDHFFAQFESQLALCNDMLEECPGPYLAGHKPGWADVQAYFPFWMARGNIAATETLVAPFAALRAWEQRMAGVGHGESRSVDPQFALDIARRCESEVSPGIHTRHQSERIAVGDEVSVAPDDYGQDPVCGKLVQLSDQSIAVRRNDPQVGEVVVHFPRSGFELRNS